MFSKQLVYFYTETFQLDVYRRRHIFNLLHNFTVWQWSLEIFQESEKNLLLSRLRNEKEFPLLDYLIV